MRLKTSFGRLAFFFRGFSSGFASALMLDETMGGRLCVADVLGHSSFYSFYCCAAASCASPSLFMIFLISSWPPTNWCASAFFSASSFFSASPSPDYSCSSSLSPSSELSDELQCSTWRYLAPRTNGG